MDLLPHVYKINLHIFGSWAFIIYHIFYDMNHNEARITAIYIIMQIILFIFFIVGAGYTTYKVPSRHFAKSLY
jgi:hypothetical protein